MKIQAPFSIDTRTLQSGDLFVALDGAHQKGFVFLEEAFRRGAVSALCAEHYRNEVPQDLVPKIIFVKDPVFEMANLARLHRNQFSIPVIGVAGSVGKTSTKQFLSYLLSRRAPLLATTGNLNNHLGLPMMLSRLRSEHQAAVLEMGADHVGDLKNLVFIAEPDFAVLTPIAAEHLSGFGSLAGVYNGELEILASPRLKTLVTVHGDAELDLRLKSWRGKTVRVGFSPDADVVISDVRVEDGSLKLRIQDQAVTLPTPASFLALNAGLAAAMAHELGTPWKDMGGTWTPEMPKGRFAMREISRGLTVIDDTYNSSPRAFAAAIHSVGDLRFSRKQLVFSDMLELGSDSEKWHLELADQIAASDFAQVWAFGKESSIVIKNLNAKKKQLPAHWFESAESLARALTEQVREGDLILLKGSRGMRVERVLEILEKSLS